LFQKVPEVTGKVQKVLFVRTNSNKLFVEKHDNETKKQIDENNNKKKSVSTKLENSTFLFFYCKAKQIEEEWQHLEPNQNFLIILLNQPMIGLLQMKKLALSKKIKRKQC